MTRPLPILAMCSALSALGAGARAAPGERTDGQRLLGVCQTLLGEGSSTCEVVTDWSVQKTVDVPLAEQPQRKGLSYTIRLVEGQTRYVLGMTSIVTLDGLIPEGTQVRGIVVSLQRGTFPEGGGEPLFTTVAGALVGDADPLCGCPYVASGGQLAVSLRDELGNPIAASSGALIESLAYGERMIVQLDSVYDLSAGIMLPGEPARIQACVQYAPLDEVEGDLPGCFDEGGAVRSVRACTSFDFEDYAKPGNAKVILEEALQLPSHDFIEVNGFKARSGSPLVTPTATLVPVLPGAGPVTFEVAASGQPNTETVISVKGDVSCADVVECGEGAVCTGTLSNTATLEFGDGRGRVSSTATTDVVCAAHSCSATEVAGCDDGDPCTTDSCEIGVGCVHTAYEGPCDDGDACTSGETCVDGVCLVGERIACDDDGNSCTIEVCDEELGCVRTVERDRARCEDGDPCTVDDICIQGTCTSGAAVSCDDHNPCTADACTSDGTCANAPLDGAAGTCEDGNACTVGDRCVEGACVSGVGPTCPDDGNPCTVATCLPEGGCITTIVPDTTPCSDGNACSVGDQCQAGVCRSGGLASCDDRNVCTKDGCDPELGCYNAPRAGSCDDGSACTSTSACDNGQCVGTNAVDCDDGNPCTVDSCDPASGCRHQDIGNGALCDDGDPCTTGESCQGGACLASALTECDDNNPCTSSTCLPGQGCVHVPRSGSCEDGNPCTGPDTCDVGACKPGGVVSCDDNNPCTADSCDARTGCKYVPVSGACDDGDLCTGAGVCSQGKCTKGAAISCDDGNPCTTGQCDAVQGCVQLQRTGSCDDGDACTGPGTCQLGSCTPGAPIVCDDGNACTADYCKEGVGCATLPRSNVPCDDGKVCTTLDTCQSGVCVGGPALDCDDGNPCTADSCGAEGCRHVAISGGCSDGDLCTVGDLCVLGVCQPGAAVACDDGNACTTDQCEAATGECVNTRLAVGATCDDGDGCTGCPWPEPLVRKGFHALDARPDPGYFPGASPAGLELQDFLGPGTGKALFLAGDDLRWVVLPDGSSAVRGTLRVATGGARAETEVWVIEMKLTFRGLGRAGNTTPFYELPPGTQTSVWTDHWEYWALANGATLTRTSPSPDFATLSPDANLKSLPLQVGLRASGRNFGHGASMPLAYTRGTRQGTGVLRVDLEREHCAAADTCTSSVCSGGSESTMCRDLAAGDYCTYTAEDLGTACSSSNPTSGACILAQGFTAIAVERTACSSVEKGVAIGHTGYRRWGFTSAQKIDAFLPTTALVNVGLDQCNPGSTSATPVVGRVLALSIAISLSDAGVLPAPEGVPLGELVRLTGDCAGLTLREIARRAEVVVANAPTSSVACNDLATLDPEVTKILEGFRNCQGVMDGVGLPE